jgi:drug/metabolite transporter (DMT)-like permease
VPISRNEKLGYAAFLGASLIWGFSFMFTKKALAHLDGRLFDLLSYRFVISSTLLLLLWAFKLIKISYKGKDIKGLIIMSLLQPGAYFIFETMGIARVATSEVGLILAMFPIVTTVFGVAFLKERVTPKHWGFIMFSVMGVLLINGFGYKPGDSTNLGRFFLMMAVLIGTTYNMLSRKLSTQFTPVERTLAMMLTGAVIFSSLALYNHISAGTMGLFLKSLIDPAFTFSIAYLSLGCSLMAFFFVSFSATHLEMSRSSVLGNTNTLVSVLAGVFLLHEPFYWYHIVGGLIIVTGVVGAALASSAMVADTRKFLARQVK